MAASKGQPCYSVATGPARNERDKSYGPPREHAMLNRISAGSIALAAVLITTTGASLAFDETRYPDLASQWHRVGGTQWDPSKPGSRGQQAPLTPEYQAIFDVSLADQDAGGHGNDSRSTCRSSGMPRIMA